MLYKFNVAQDKFSDQYWNLEVRFQIAGIQSTDGFPRWIYTANTSKRTSVHVRDLCLEFSRLTVPSEDQGKKSALHMGSPFFDHRGRITLHEAERFSKTLSAIRGREQFHAKKTGRPSCNGEALQRYMQLFQIQEIWVPHLNSTSSLEKDSYTKVPIGKVKEWFTLLEQSMWESACDLKTLLPKWVAEFSESFMNT